MGQKTHPTGFRTGVNKTHASTWYANYGAYSQVLKEDYEIRKFFEKEFEPITIILFFILSFSFTKNRSTI